MGNCNDNFKYSFGLNDYSHYKDIAETVLTDRNFNR